MGAFYLIHYFDPNNLAVVLVEVLVAAFTYKVVVGIVSKLFSK